MMNDERLRELYQQALARRAAEPGGCEISPETMLDVLTHKLPEADHRRILLAILTDPRCRREFELLRAVSRDESRPAARQRRFFIPISLAAGLALLIGGGIYLKTLQRSTTDTTRSGSDSGEIALVTPGPGGAAGIDRRFVWRAVPRTLRYDFNLTTPGGQLVYAASQADTSLTIPDSVKMISDTELRWWVEATTGDGRQLRSAIRRLRTTSP